MDQKQGKIKKRILTPFAFALILLLILPVLGVSFLQKLDIDEDVKDRLHGAQELLPGFLHEESKFLQAQIEFLKGNKSLQKAWLAKDREMLLQSSMPIFKDSLAPFEVTHFYFIGMDRICFLRVHRPGQYGDYIGRHTMDDAARETTMAYGIELGPLGTFTLRVVSPWKIGGKLAGYIELGEEIEHLIPSLKKILGVELVFVIDKTNINRARFEEGVKMPGRAAGWNKYPRSVVINSTLDNLPAQVHGYLGNSSPANFTFKYSADGREYRGGSIPLVDAGRHTVGELIVLFEVTKKTASLFRLSNALIVFSVLTGGVLFTFFYFFTSNVESDLMKTFHNLDIEIMERNKVEGELKEHQDHLEVLVGERTRKIEKTNEMLQKEIGERKKAEQELQLAARVIEHTSDGVMITDANKRIVKVNHAFGAITGYTITEVIGKPTTMMASDRHNASFYKSMIRSIEERGQWEGEIWNKRKNGEVYPAWMTISPVKDSSGRLQNYVAIFTDVTNRVLAEQRLQRLAHFDPLTDLPNRNLLYDRISKILAKMRRDKHRAAVLFLDLDKFKSINDELGHEAGDATLREVARRLNILVRDSDTVGRIGGDEFIIALQDLTKKEDVMPVIERLISEISKPIQFEQGERSIGVSVGISIFPDNGEDADTLINQADAAMYAAKLEGSNRYRFA